MTKKTTSIDAVLNEQIHRLSEMNRDELQALNHALERAYVHVMIEQALRDRTSLTGAPR